MMTCSYCDHKLDDNTSNCHNPNCKNFGGWLSPPYKLEPTSTQTSFVKHDLGKPLMSLIEPRFIIELGKLLTFGANKYEKNNWKKCEDPTRYKDALLRHLYAYLSGELIDPESGMEHLTAVAFNVMALQYFDNK